MIYPIIWFLDFNSFTWLYVWFYVRCIFICDFIVITQHLAAVQLHFLEISAFSTLIQRRTGASEKISSWSTLNWRRPIFQRSEYYRRGSALTSNFTTTYWRFSIVICANNIGSDSRQKISGAKTFYQHGLKLIQRLLKSAVVHMLLAFRRKNCR